MTAHRPRSSSPGSAAVDRSDATRRSFAVLVALVLGCALAACAQVPTMRGQIEGLSKVAAQAERNGAIRCAPRELATAKSHLEFATVELDQGFMLRAQEHLQLAEANAHAAYDLSPPQKCAERGFVDEPPPPGDPDTDGDGITDTRDSCVVTPEDKDAYLDEDGCPEPDNDLDTVADDADKGSTPAGGSKDCKNDPEDPDGFEDADGCPEPDNDKDTVVDLDDQCPNEPGEPGGDKPGCPKKPSLVIVTEKEIKITQQIHFEFDKDRIRPESFPILDAVVEVLVQNPKIRIEIQGHTDNKGSAFYNKSLSDRRATSVRKYLTSKGIDASRLTSKGYGMERPIVPNTSEQNRALNRRVQFIRTEGGDAAGTSAPKP
jgi:outer membrane protein OmpA-like peptidoglycan-associated protein